MEVVVKTDYQDVYRISYGVLLVVNKFEFAQISDGTCPYVSAIYNKGYSKPYIVGCQKALRVLVKNVVHEPTEMCQIAYELPVGTVLYDGYPVKPTENKTMWEYGIKTDGLSFSGRKEEILKMIQDITEIINEQH